MLANFPGLLNRFKTIVEVMKDHDVSMGRARVLDVNALSKTIDKTTDKWTTW